MIDQEVEKVGTLPAACHVDPAVSSFFFEQHAIGPAFEAEMIEYRGADDATADYDNAGTGGKIGHGCLLPDKTDREAAEDECGQFVERTGYAL